MPHHPVSSWLGVAAFLTIMAIGGGAFVYAILLRLNQLKMAKRPEVRWDQVKQRLRNFMIFVMGQKRLPANGYTYSGILHIFIFGAFVVLSVDTINFVTDGLFKILDVAMGKEPGHPFHLPLSQGPYQGLADTFRFLCIVGLGMAFVNRLIIRPKRLPLSRDGLVTLFFILGLMTFEVLQIGFEQALLNQRGQLPDGAQYTWFSGLFARLASGLNEDLLTLGYRAAWWAHLVNLLAFSNYVPFSKHSHVFASPLNIFFMDLGPKGAIRKMIIDTEAEGVSHFGARNLEDLSWKQIFDGLSCTECGRCTDNCPAARSDKPLKPMEIIVTLKHHAEDRFRDRKKPVNLAEDPKVILGAGVIDPDVLWSCTTCRACMEVCPVGNEHVPSILDMRRYLTMSQGEVGHGAANALKKIERRGNPWGMAKKDREAWTKDLAFGVKRYTEESAEYLFWVGCAGAFDDRGKRTTQALARLMHSAGVDFAILGKDEQCNGETARRLGDEYLFQTMCNQNVEQLNGLGVKKIVTACPHCFNTLKNEYPQFGGQYEVIHHTELLDQLIQSGRLKLKGDESPLKRVVYHDSCYLGRYNDVYDPQRRLLDALPDLERVETERHRQQGLCCGAGGGHMWMEMNIGKRMNQVRTDELLETRPDVIAVACNFCMTMVADGVKSRDREDSVKVMDLAELLDSRVSPPSA